MKQRLGHASLTTTEIYLSGEFLTEEEEVRAQYGAAYGREPMWEAVR